MPKIKLTNLPAPLLSHIYDRARERNLTAASLAQLRIWLATNPEVPDGAWFKRFSGFTVCGAGELIKTFLTDRQAPFGTEL